MKNLLGLFTFVLITSFSIAAQAEELCTMNLKMGGGMWHDLSESQEQKIRKVIENKQYKISTEPGAVYQMHITRGIGFICATGLTNYEATFQMPAQYQIELHGPDLDVNETQDFQGLALGMDTYSFHRLMKQLRQLPSCPHAEITD